MLTRGLNLVFLDRKIREGEGGSRGEGKVVIDGWDGFSGILNGCRGTVRCGNF